MLNQSPRSVSSPPGFQVCWVQAWGRERATEGREKKDRKGRGHNAAEGGGGGGIVESGEELWRGASRAPTYTHLRKSVFLVRFWQCQVNTILAGREAFPQKTPPPQTPPLSPRQASPPPFLLSSSSSPSRSLAVGGRRARTRRLFVRGSGCGLRHDSLAWPSIKALSKAQLRH